MSDSVSQFSGSVHEGGVLGDVRRALGHSVSVRPAPLEPFVEPSATHDLEALVARFSTELDAVSGNVYRLVSDKLQFVDELATGIADICHPAGATKIAVSGSTWLAEIGLATQLEARGLQVFVTADSGSLGHEELVAQLADCGAGVTAVDYAIAETGSIVLGSNEVNALLVSLLPAIHIAVLRPAQISAGLNEVITKLNRERVGHNGSCRSASFITGPSRTSDVELTLSIGVHGPKELHVIIAGD